MRRRGPAVVVLSERDEAVLSSVAEHGLLSAGQVERLWFGEGHVSALAARRRCQAVLLRLVDEELLERLDRRLGGHRAGSAGHVYRLTTRGRRALGQVGRGARAEPSEHRRLHVLACAEVSVRLVEAQRRGDLRSLAVTHEPATWRRFTTPHGVAVLKPDLLVEVVTLDSWALRWFVEVDRATEHVPTVLRQCQAYEAFWRSGQEAHAIFPRVLWSVPDVRRASALRTAIEKASGLTADLFRVATTDQTVPVVAGRAIKEVKEGGDYGTNVDA